MAIKETENTIEIRKQYIKLGKYTGIDHYIAS